MEGLNILLSFVVVGDMDIQVYSSKEKASVTVNGEVVSNFRNGVRYLQFIIQLSYTVRISIF